MPANPTYHSKRSGNLQPPQRLSTRDMVRHPAFALTIPKSKPQVFERKPNHLPVMMSAVAIDAVAFGLRKISACACTRYRCEELLDVTPGGDERPWCSWYGSAAPVRHGNPQRVRECLLEGGR